MSEIIKDMKFLSVAGKILKVLYFLKSTVTVAIIVFSVLEGKRFLTDKNTETAI